MLARSVWLRLAQADRAEDCAHLLRTIQERLRERILQSGYVQVDETPVKVLDAERGGKAAQAYLSSTVDGGGAVVAQLLTDIGELYRLERRARACAMPTRGRSSRPCSGASRGCASANCPPAPWAVRPSTR